MLLMSMASPWSLPACVTSGIKNCKKKAAENEIQSRFVPPYQATEQGK